MKTTEEFIVKYSAIQGFNFEAESNIDNNLESQSYLLSDNIKNIVSHSDLPGLRNGLNAISRSIFNESSPHKPSFKIRGVIEGFYGKPWTHEQRLRGLNFLRYII